MTYNTGNPIGSTDARDLSDNAQNFDEAVNGPSSTWVDRLGNTRTSLRGQVGYTGTGSGGAIQSYTSGLVLSGYNVIILYSGEFYRPSASATLPYTTTATLPDVDSNLVSIGDANLRQDLANDASGSGAALVSMEGGPSVEAAVLDRVILVTSIKSLIGLTPLDKAQYSVSSYHQDEGVGGRLFVYDAARSKDDHNGGTVISSTVPWNGTYAALSNFLNGTGETDPGGTGCFAVLDEGKADITDFGAIPDSAEFVDVPLQKAFYSIPTGGTVTAYPSGYIINQNITELGRLADGTTGVETNFDATGATFVSDLDQATLIKVYGKCVVKNGTFDKVHIFIETPGNETRVTKNKFINQNNIYVRTEANKCLIDNNIFIGSAEIAAFFNCISVITDAVGTKIFGNDIQYEANAINVDATNGFVTEDTLIYGNRFKTLGLKEPGNSIKIEATTNVIIANNIFDGNDVGTHCLFIVGSVTGEPAGRDFRRILISDNIFRGFENAIFNVTSSSTYGGGSNFNTQIIISGNTFDNCDRGIIRLQGNEIITSNIFRNNIYSIDLSESGGANGLALISGNKFIKSGKAHIYLGNLTDDDTVSIPETRIINNSFYGWNTDASVEIYDASAISNQRNAFAGGATSTVRPKLIISGNSFNVSSGNELNYILIEEATVKVTENDSYGTALTLPLNLSPNVSTAFYISEPVVYEGNSWQLVDAAPTTGLHQIGEIWKNSAPAAGEYQYFVCTVQGTPGTFKGMGLIET
jgi:hypothetical protein